MFSLKKRGPSKPSVHQEGCKIVAADPNVSIEWQEIEHGHWRALCQCGVEHYRAAVSDDRVRLNPFDPATSRHLGQCEYISETDPAVLKVLLKVTDKEDYSWVECGSCAAGWQVAHYAESVG